MGEGSREIVRRATIKAALNTVNVMEIADGSILRLSAFQDNPMGNKLAETLFQNIALENGADKEQLGDFTEDGYYSRDHANYELFLIHSNTPENEG